MEDTKVTALVKEIREEQQISPFLKDETLNKYVREAEYDINDTAGKVIDYDYDLVARSLLKNYVLYANHKRLAEFKQLYSSEYAKLQAKYY